MQSCCMCKIKYGCIEWNAIYYINLLDQCSGAYPETFRNGYLSSVVQEMKKN